MAAFDFSQSFSGINSALANLGKQNDARWLREAQADVGQSLAGGDYNAAAQKAFSYGDHTTGLGLLGLAQKDKDRASDASLVQGIFGGGAPAGGTTPLASLGKPTEIESKFVDGVKSAGLTNPFGLGAVAAYGKAESGFQPQNVNRTWSDPSQSGQAGTAGGIMSWRADRLQNLYSFAKQRGESQPSVETQAAFLAQEDPTLLPKLQAAKTPQEANQIMANAWKFAGYNQPGGENARRLALTQGYAQRFSGQGGAPVAAPVQVAQNEGDVQRLEAQQGNPVIDSPAPGQAPVQVAQAAPQPGAPVADVPAQGAAEAQFYIPGTNTAVPQSLASNPRIQNLTRALVGARTEGAKTAIKQMLDLEIADAKNNQDQGGPLARQKAQLDIQKSQRDLDGKGFRSLVTPEERTAAGVDPNYKGAVQVDRDNQLHFPGKATTEVTVKNEGTIPGGYRVERDADGLPVQMSPIPGSPAAKEIEDANKKTDLTKAQTEQTGNVVINSLNDIDRLMKEANLPTTGAIGSRVAEMKGTAAHDIKNALGTIGANISFQNLAQMRAASPTGGALGAVSDGEQKMLQNAWGALEQSQSEGQFKTNLGRVRALFERTIHGRVLTPQERLSGGPMTADRVKGLRDEASQAIAGGAPRDAVLKRLNDYGVPAGGL